MLIHYLLQVTLTKLIFVLRTEKGIKVQTVHKCAREGRRELGSSLCEWRFINITTVIPRLSDPANEFFAVFRTRLTNMDSAN